jgi:hypothetical protein
MFVSLGFDEGILKTVFAGAISIGWIAGSIAWVIFAIRYNRKQWPTLKAIWDNSYVCNRCHHQFCLTGE